MAMPIVDALMEPLCEAAYITARLPTSTPLRLSALAHEGRTDSTVCLTTIGGLLFL